ncbi:MAG: biopolymer transporter ExbD [Chlorobium sp.]|nr:biopolymer transporter ExbD [Chlorobium phaeovibrioides]NQU46697.1 biopolymer transporter ExbD [Chlorobium sp.]
MARIKAKRVGFRLDMTPMVDVAFLLLTFFMLTTKFRPPEPVVIDLPSSHSEQKLPESSVLTVMVSSTDALFMGISSQSSREVLFNAAIRPKLEAAGYSGKAVTDSLVHFRLAETFPVQREELSRFVTMARYADHGLRPVVRADANAGFEAVNYVISVYKDANLLTFNLVTMMEKGVR